MSYNPTYGGQFQGLRGAAQKSSGNSGISKGAGKAAGGASGTGGSPAPCGGNTEPGDKVTVTLGGLKQVKLDAIKEDDERYFIVVGLFEGDDLNAVVNHKRNRTKAVKGQLVGENYMCSFSGEKIILPIADPKKRFLLYICAVTITKGTDEQGKVFKDISLMGIGFSQTFEVDACKKYQHTTAELRLVEGGDPSISPGKLELTVDVCKGDKGEAVPEDVEESIMAQFQG
ncbi:hypothetical protein, conserved [Eimeria tenella]|uniref:Uncharacterized protein n=1 Tax=Eimeria tenella TaxID=5802 RepID=H9B9X6_EIMTE|nr:hypothetical protein, conserved [Eimeria tenella]AET50786.1 hypothetical protein [Eimeria tenella]CDJ41863.1 hypothetical protein, conserved [Eimeria tenella]|eukprot:XP_013232613.1 hypothetical protein, conserved [Eimeria tenella]